MTHVGAAQLSSKIAVVDLPSLLFMKHALGIDLFNWPGLCEVLRKKVGSCPSLSEIFCTIHPEKYKCSKLTPGLLRDLHKTRGITLVPAHSQNESDDRMVKKLLHVSSCKCQELVLLSTDGDLVEEMCWLGQKKNIHTHLVATELPDVGSGNCCLSRDILDRIRRHEISFYDLKHFKPRIQKIEPAYH